MKLEVLSNLSLHFPRVDKADRVVIPDRVKVVVGTQDFNCSGLILARRSTVLLKLMKEKEELYLDEFTDCYEGLLDAIDLLYGAEVAVSIYNIQALIKFSLMYKMDKMFDLCLDWVAAQLSLLDLFTFIKMEMFVRSIDYNAGHRLSEACEHFISKETTAEDLLLVSKDWTEDADVMSFLLHEDLLQVTLPTITDWINSEEKVITVLDKVEDFEQERLAECLEASLKMFAKMNGICETVATLRRVNEVQTSITGKKFAFDKPILQIPTTNFLRSLQPKLWRNFTINQVISLDFHYKIEIYFYAEIMIDWISFNKATQEDLEQVWAVFKRYNFERVGSYVALLKSSVNNYNPGLEIPIQVKGTNPVNFNAEMSYEDSDAIVHGLNLNNYKSITLSCDGIDSDINCFIKGCILKTFHFNVLKLTDTIPCYQLDEEDELYEDAGHYHHDNTKHWYASEEINGERVLLSFVTNSMEEVIEKVKTATNIHLHILILDEISI